MFKVDITKEVKKRRESSKEEAEVLVQSAQLLLDGDNGKERDLLKKIGLGHQIQEAERANSIDLERKTFETEYGVEIVMQEDEIRDLALKYDLKFLQASKFKGSVDLSIGPKIRRFVDSNDINPSKSDFFLLGPGKAFNLKEREIVGRKKFSADLDPVLFYKIPDNTNETMYVMVHKWGNDFTIMRYLRGLVLENSASYIVSQLTIGFALSLILCNVLDGDYTIGYGNIALSAFLALSYTGIMVLVRLSRLNQNDSWDEAFNVELWDSEHKK